MWRLSLVAVIAAMIIVGRVALEEDLSWVAWTLVTVAVALLTLIRWPYGALFVLVGCSAMPRFFVEIFGWKARPEHFAVGMIFLAVFVWVLRRKKFMVLQTIDYYIIIYILCNYMSSAFSSPLPSATLRWALMNNLAVLPYFLIRLLVRNMEALRKVFWLVLGVGFAESCYGLLCYASHYAFGTATGMGIGYYLVDVAAPYGSLYEPNLFGAYTAVCAVLFLALYLVGEKQSRGFLICYLVASLAAALSLSRAALIALVVASGWVFWRARRHETTQRSNLMSLVPVSALILIMGVTVVGGVVRERFADLFSQGLEEETALTRYVVIAEALKDIPNHPLLGTGTSSLQLSFEWTTYVPEWGNERAWIPNVIVRILHDTGLFGLSAFLAFVISLWLKIRQALRGRNSQLPMLVGLSAGALLYSISFQSTDGTILAFSWVHLGLLATAAILLNGVGDSSSNTGPLPATSA